MNFIYFFKNLGCVFSMTEYNSNPAENLLALTIFYIPFAQVITCIVTLSNTIGIIENP